MRKNIISISGFSGVGKSTVINGLIDCTHLPVLKYADIHREAIKKSGFPLGIRWIEAKGFDDYEDGVLEVFKEKIDSNTDKDLIVDGIFSYKCFSYLKNLPDINFINILLETSYDTRLKRFLSRENFNQSIASDKLKEVDWMKYYCGLGKILNEADYIIDTTNTPQKINQELGEILSDWHFSKGMER